MGQKSCPGALPLRPLGPEHGVEPLRVRVVHDPEHLLVFHVDPRLELLQGALLQPGSEWRSSGRRAGEPVVATSLAVPRCAINSFVWASLP